MNQNRPIGRLTQWTLALVLGIVAGYAAWGLFSITLVPSPPAADLDTQAYRMLLVALTTRESTKAADWAHNALTMAKDEDLRVLADFQEQMYRSYVSMNIQTMPEMPDEREASKLWRQRFPEPPKTFNRRGLELAAAMLDLNERALRVDERYKAKALAELESVVLYRQRQGLADLVFWAAFITVGFIAGMHEPGQPKSHSASNSGGNAVVISCPRCSQKLRVPSGARRLEVTCPKCRLKFTHEREPSGSSSSSDSSHGQQSGHVNDAADHYGALGVSPTASMSEIKAAYREQAKRCHPDAGGTHEAMIAVTTAWFILSDPISRAKYDRDRSPNKGTPPTAEWADIVRTAKAQAEQYPRDRDAFAAWIDSITEDAIQAQYGTDSEGYFQYATSSNSDTAALFILAGGFLGCCAAVAGGIWVYFEYTASTTTNKAFLARIILVLMSLPFMGTFVGKWLHSQWRDWLISRRKNA